MESSEEKRTNRKAHRLQNQGIHYQYILGTRAKVTHKDKVRNVVDEHD